MAYATLEEAWGQDYKSFLSPASLSPEWLEKCRKPLQRESAIVPNGFSSEREPKFRYSEIDDYGTPYTEKREHFTSSPKRLSPVNEDEDYDLLQEGDEFNMPMKFESPEAIDPGMDDYYKLINSEFDKDTLNSYRYPYQDTNYAEEIQFTEDNNKKCQASLPNRAKYHLQKCKQCRLRLKAWLEEFGEILSEAKEIPNDIKSDIMNTKDKVKQLIPSHLRSIVDLIFFVAIGLFLIFVLDTFVRLGKSFSKRG
jgi:hypothetical protein